MSSICSVTHLYDDHSRNWSNEVCTIDDLFNCTNAIGNPLPSVVPTISIIKPKSIDALSYLIHADDPSHIFNLSHLISMPDRKLNKVLQKAIITIIRISENDVTREMRKRLFQFEDKNWKALLLEIIKQTPYADEFITFIRINNCLSYIVIKFRTPKLNNNGEFVSLYGICVLSTQLNSSLAGNNSNTQQNDQNSPNGSKQCKQPWKLSYVKTGEQVIDFFSALCRGVDIKPFADKILPKSIGSNIRTEFRSDYALDNVELGKLLDDIKVKIGRNECWKGIHHYQAMQWLTGGNLNKYISKVRDAIKKAYKIAQDRKNIPLTQMYVCMKTGEIHYELSLLVELIKDNKRGNHRYNGHECRKFVVILVKDKYSKLYATMGHLTQHMSFENIALNNPPLILWQLVHLSKFRNDIKDDIKRQIPLVDNELKCATSLYQNQSYYENIGIDNNNTIHSVNVINNSAARPVITLRSGQDQYYSPVVFVNNINSSNSARMRQNNCSNTALDVHENKQFESDIKYSNLTQFECSEIKEPVWIINDLNKKLDQVRRKALKGVMYRCGIAFCEAGRITASKDFKFIYCNNGKIGFKVIRTGNTLQRTQEKLWSLFMVYKEVCRELFINDNNIRNHQRYLNELDRFAKDCNDFANTELVVHRVTDRWAQMQESSGYRQPRTTMKK